MANKIYTITYVNHYAEDMNCESKVAFSKDEAQKIFDDYVRTVSDIHSGFEDEILCYLGESRMEFDKDYLGTYKLILIEEHEVGMQ